MKRSTPPPRTIACRDLTIAGICHARGTTANAPPQWLLYIVVKDVDASCGRCVELDGQLLDGPRALGSGRFAVIKDPAGAVCALRKSWSRVKP